VEFTLLLRDPKEPKGLSGPLEPTPMLPTVVRFDSPGSPGDAIPVPVLAELMGLDAWVGEVGLRSGAVTWETGGLFSRFKPDVS
jgi:hypothetical protein